MVKILQCIAIRKYFIYIYIWTHVYECKPKNGVMLICMAMLMKKLYACKGRAGIYESTVSISLFLWIVCYAVCITIITYPQAKPYSWISLTLKQPLLYWKAVSASILHYYLFKRGFEVRKDTVEWTPDCHIWRLSRDFIQHKVGISYFMKNLPQNLKTYSWGIHNQNKLEYLDKII